MINSRAIWLTVCLIFMFNYTIFGCVGSIGEERVTAVLAVRGNTLFQLEISVLF